MNTKTTRRALLGAMPAAVLAVSMPVSATGHNERWQRAKARFLNSAQRVEAAGLSHDAMEREQSAFEQEAPTRELTFTKKGFRIANEGGDFTVHPSQGRFVLTRGTIRHAPDELKATPDFAAYKAELAAWRDRFNAQGDRRDWDAIEREWGEALDAHCEAWQAMIACPVSSAADVAEKLRLAKIDRFGDESDLRELVDALQADIARLHH